MLRIQDKARFAPSLALALLLVAAQSVAVVHVLAHDTATPQNQVCTTCVAASQLASACVDHAAEHQVEQFVARFCSTQQSTFDSIHVLAARQRGPPASL
jgi:hypothetical protein